MKTTVQARLDEKAQAALERLRRRGLSTSQVIREGIHLVDQRHPTHPRPKLIGAGLCDSGVPDLATNKKHLEDFGKKSMGHKNQRPAKDPTR